MKITKVFAKNYKAFREINLELKDLNLIIGRNGAGKSSLIRLFPFILESIICSEDDYICFNPSGIDLAANYSDLVYGHTNTLPLSLGLSFILDGKEYSFITECMYHSDFFKVIPLSFEYKTEDECFVFKNTLEKENIYRLNDDKNIELDFSGLLPKVERIENSDLKESLIHIEIFRKEILNKYLSYIGPFRRKMERIYPNRFNFSIDVGSEGEYTPYILATYDQKKEYYFIDSINKWMRNNLENTELILERDKNGFTVNIKKNDITSNIVDHGIGFTQLLPLIVSRFARSSSGNSGMDIVEQPELHMHPSMCGSIIDLYLSDMDDDSVIVLETHSKESILRLRRRIAEDKSRVLLNCVQVIYVDQTSDGSRIELINILEDGSCSWWPEGVFEEAYEDIIAIEEVSSEY
ncbi:AAA family ATPase [Photobacterium damselae]